MLETTSSTLFEEEFAEEHAELESVAASLARTPRLEQLLRYLARKYFEGQSDHLTEYNIATEVFGRKKTEFIASQDAIARVETHRLRKRLAAFYENEGREHTVQISIPLGTYVPNFSERATLHAHAPKILASNGNSEHPLNTAAGLEAAQPDLVPNEPKIAATRPGHRRTVWLLGLAALVVAGIVFRWLPLRTRESIKSAPIAQDPSQSATAARGGSVPLYRAGGSSPTPVSPPFRMIAGYTGPPQRDNTGDVWQQDEFAHGGWPRRASRAFITRTGNPLIFRYGRDGDSSYDIPLAPGVYELHLYFMQDSDTAQSEDAENKAIFNVAINRELTVRGFDIVADAMGRNTADERVFRDVSPAADGMLHIRLSTVLGTPSLSAIKILGGTSHAQLPTRIVMQPASFTDSKGQFWRSDDYFWSGRYLAHNIPATNPDPNVLPFERFGHFEYAIPVDPRDRYTLVLHFVELYFGTPERYPQVDSRLFRVLCNGQTLLDDFDILREAGALHTLTKTFSHLKPSAQGKLNIDFEPISNYATVSAIEVLDESH